MAVDVAKLKQQAAEKAVEFVESGMVVGLGTGSTAVFATRAIGQMLKDGRLKNVIGIPTSEATARVAQEWAIPLTTLDGHPVIDITIDGADEIDPNLDLIKGLGGALLREKIVAASSNHFVVVGDKSKKVNQLGTKAPVPVEVVPFARRPVKEYLESLGARVVERVINDQTFISDEGNIILDAYFIPITNPVELAHSIRQQPGVVEHGLFLGMTTAVIVALPSGIEISHRN